jgi:hypothetical protein
MRNWEKTLLELCTNKCNELGYSDAEYIDNVYDVFHEALELDEKADDYRHKIKEIRRNTILDVCIDILGIERDAITLVNSLLEELDVTLK